LDAGNLAVRAEPLIKPSRFAVKLRILDYSYESTMTVMVSIRIGHTHGMVAQQMVGQEAVIGRLRIVIEGAKARGTKVPNVLLTGPSGMGKTSLAGVIAHELGYPLMAAAGPTLRKTGDLAGLLASVKGETALFVDEIHRLPNEVCESLYEALEDSRLTRLLGYGSDARSVTTTLPPIVFIGATDQPGALPKALRDRFGYIASLTPYSDEELAEIVRRAFIRGGIKDPEMGPCRVVAQRSKGCPRIAIHLTGRVADVCALEGTTLTVKKALEALQAFGISSNGLDEDDHRILRALVHTFSGRPVGINSLAQCLDLDESTVREHEANLVRSGFMVRTRAGRLAMPKARDVIGAP
jgi:Holliday junction DNA helicase RuvB